ncbi:MAG: virulence factor SrfB [Verrucomicrobiaceae bacterium]|nr:virulence factor SrfB [Verrucomicrobiaceae bacterium]
MTVDIGGGTTDISIIEYRDLLMGKGVEWRPATVPRLQHHRGDTLAKEIVEAVLLPALGTRF